MSAVIPVAGPAASPSAPHAPILAVLILGLIACADGDPGQLTVGQAFPLAELESTSPLGDSVAATEGRTLVINFWATWCAPCRREMPDLQRLSDRLDPARYRVIGISVDTDRNLVREFVRAYAIRFPIRQDHGRRLASAVLGLEVYPTTFVVSPDGIVVARIDGAIEALPTDSTGGSLPGIAQDYTRGG